MIISEWEKQILASCLKVSRGTDTYHDNLTLLVQGGYHNPDCLSVTKFVDLTFYILRLRKNLNDIIRQRGFDCNIKVGSNVIQLIKEAGYCPHALSQHFALETHDGYANEVEISFYYSPETKAALMVEDDVECVDAMLENISMTLNEDQKCLEKRITSYFKEAYRFFDIPISC